MSYWGTGTREDPYVCDTWDSLVDRCTNSRVDIEIYVEMAAKTQQGVLIPVSERIIDMRRRSWFLSDAMVVPNRSSSIHINGNEWTILGASLRDCRLMVFNNYTVSYIENFTFKNIYLQGHSSLFAQTGTTAADYSKKVIVSNIRASGVLDLSTLSSVTGANTNIALFNASKSDGSMPGGSGFRVTACSFNFKFVAGFRLTNYNNRDSGTSTVGNFEFNNCLFNIEGKATDTYTNNPGSMIMSRTTFFGTFYFCKFTGSIYYDHVNDSECRMFLYYNGGGTLDVIDFDIYCIANAETSTVTDRIHAQSSISTAKIIQYHKAIYPHDPIPNIDYYHSTNAAAFLHPSDREEMCDRQWLLEQGFIIGTPPSD